MHNNKRAARTPRGSILLEAMLALTLLAIGCAVVARIYGNWIRASHESAQLLGLVDRARSARAYYATGLALSDINNCNVRMLSVTQPRVVRGIYLDVKRPIDLACVAVSATDRYGVKRTIEIITLPREHSYASQRL